MKLVVGPGEPDNVKFGTLLERYRRHAGFTRVEAAQVVGFTQEYLRLIEKGQRIPAAGNMLRIAQAYGVRCVDEIQDRLVIFGDVEIEFTSRVLEARESRKEAPPQLQSKKRAQKIGLIVALLIQTDDEMLDHIHANLRDKHGRAKRSTGE